MKKILSFVKTSSIKDQLLFIAKTRDANTAFELLQGLILEHIRKPNRVTTELKVFYSQANTDQAKSFFTHLLHFFHPDVLSSSLHDDISPNLFLKDCFCSIPTVNDSNKKSPLFLSMICTIMTDNVKALESISSDAYRTYALSYLCLHPNGPELFEPSNLSTLVNSWKDTPNLIVQHHLSTLICESLKYPEYAVYFNTPEICATLQRWASIPDLNLQWNSVCALDIISNAKPETTKFVACEAVYKATISCFNPPQPGYRLSTNSVLSLFRKLSIEPQVSSLLCSQEAIYAMTFSSCPPSDRNFIKTLHNVFRDHPHKISCFDTKKITSRLHRINDFLSTNYKAIVSRLINPTLDTRADKAIVLDLVNQFRDTHTNKTIVSNLIHQIQDTRAQS